MADSLFKQKLDNCRPTSYENDKGIYLSTCFDSFFNAYKSKCAIDETLSILGYADTVKTDVYKREGKKGVFYSLSVYLDKNNIGGK